MRFGVDEAITRGRRVFGIVTESERSPYGELRVLVIDDQEHVRKWMRRVLKSLGIAFDLICCDLKMPNTAGNGLIHAFSALRLGARTVKSA